MSKNTKYTKDLVPVVVPAGNYVMVGGCGVLLDKDLHGMASHGLMSLSASASRVLVVPDPAHIPESWKMKKEFVRSRSSCGDTSSNISSADESEDMKNSPASYSDAQTSKDEVRTSER